MDMPITDDEFFKLTMSSTPAVKRGKEHIVKKNESLWSIARHELGNNAKNADIQNYVYQIGKLNEKNSIKDMNNLKVNEKIYLPDSECFKASQNASAQKPASASKTVTKPAESNEKVRSVIKSEKPKTNAELGFEDLKKNLLNTNASALSVECGYCGYSESVCTVYRVNPNQSYSKKHIGSFTIDNDHKLIEIHFDGRKNEKVTKSDFAVDKNGTITREDNYGRPVETVATIDKKEIKQLETALQALIKTDPQKGFVQMKNSIVNVPRTSLYVERGSKLFPEYSYTIYGINPNQPYTKKQIASFRMDRNHNLINISFDGYRENTRVSTDRYDFSINTDGEIRKKGNYIMKMPVETTVSKKEMQQIEDVLRTLVQDLENKRK